MDNAWLHRIAPRLHSPWRGTWSRGVVEPVRMLFDHELVVVTRGACRIRIGAREADYPAGSFVIVPPGTLHSTVTLPGGVVRQCLHFDWVPGPRRRRGLPLWLHPPKSPRSTDLRPAPSWVPQALLTGRFDKEGPVPVLLETLFHRWTTGHDFDRSTCHPILQEILLRLLWKGPRRGGRKETAAGLADRVKEAIDSAPPGDTSIQPLLGALGFSYAHLCRLFTARFGLSPGRYRNAVRLERARQLLRDRRKTVTEVAHEAGFSDPAYFSRKFAELHGAPPSRWR